jgi:hypothetical protein
MAGKVKCAAIEAGDKIFTGRSHADIILGSMECHHAPQQSQGFVDNDGIFLTRKEAYSRAVEHGQIKDDGGTPLLLSEMLPRQSQPERPE